MKVSVEVVNDGETLPIPEHRTPNPGNRFLRWTGARVDSNAGTIGPFHTNTTVTAAYAFSYSQFTVTVPGGTEGSEIKIEISPLSDESPVIVDFGDGSQDSSSANGAVVSHTYEAKEESAAYSVRITGNASHFRIVDGQELVVSVERLANSIRSCDEMFAGCTNLRGIIPAWSDKCETAVRAYAGCTGLTAAVPEWGMSLWNVTACFSGCTGIMGRVPQWGNKVAAADRCFAGCASLGSDDDNVVPDWNNVTSAVGCYSGCSAMRGTIPEWTDGVGTDTTEVYSGCAMLTGNIPAWSLGLLVAVKTYYGCSGLVGVNMPTRSETSPVDVEDGDCEDCVTGTSDAVRARFLETWGGTYQAGDDAVIFDVSLENDGTVSFEISTNEGARTVCLVDGGHSVACSDGINTVAVGAGAHEISISGEVGAFRIASDSAAFVTEVKSFGAFVTKLDGAFENCVNLTSACPISDGVTSAIRCFAGCTSLAGSVPAWTTGLVDATECYSGCMSLTGDIPLWGKGLTAVSGCFSGCTGLTGTAATDPAERMPSRFSDMNATRDCVSGCSDAVRALFTPLWGGTEMGGSTVINMTTSEDTVIRLTVRIGMATAISWGDGSIDLLTDVEGEITSTHVYAPGSYALKIGSGATSFSFDDNGSTAPRSLTAWGDGITSAVNGFLNCQNFTACAAFPDSLTNVSGLFKNSGMTTPLEWNKAVLAVGTYEDCADLEGDIPAWGDDLTDVSACYRNCVGLTVPEDKAEDFEWLMPERIEGHDSVVTGADGLVGFFFPEWGGEGGRFIKMKIFVPDYTDKRVQIGQYELASGELEISWDGGETFCGETVHTYENSGEHEIVLRGDLKSIGNHPKNHVFVGRVVNPDYSLVSELVFGGGLVHFEEIGSRAFSSTSTTTHTLLSELSIPESVTKIGERAFQLNSLRTIYVGENVTEIGESAFNYSSYMTSAEFACKNVNLGAGVLAHSPNLVSVSIPDEWTTIPKSFLYECTTIGTFTIPAGVRSIGDYAFYGCNNLVIQELPQGLARIGEFAFSRSGFVADEIPDGVTSIGQYAFSSTPITQIILPSSLESLGRRCFENCAQLAAIDMGKVTKLETIPNDFATETKIVEIIIPEGVKEITQRAFKNCTELKTIRLPSTLRIGLNDYYYGSVGGEAFYGCVNVTDIYCAAMQAPKVKESNDAGTGAVYNGAFGNTATSERQYLVGRNAYSAKTNRLHIPKGANGYSADEWKSILCSTSYCGFQVVEESF